MEKLMHVSSSPHVRKKTTTTNIMLDVVIALCPALIVGVWHFGYRALVLVGISVITTVLSEYLYEKLLKMPITVGDMSAVVTGLLLGMNLPSTVPFWMPVLGGAFAIIVSKMLYGGLGYNFMNPALAGRAFLTISFTGLMTNFNYDGLTTATPMALLKAGEQVPLLDMFLGQTGGTIGETCALALILGGVYLLVKGVISWRIPGTYILTVLVFALIFGGHGFDANYLLGHLVGGGLMLGAIFMATDYVTSPITPLGQIVFGIFIGLLTGLFRIFGGSAEGVSYAIILGNLVVPLIERFTMPAAFGRGKRDGQNK